MSYELPYYTNMEALTLTQILSHWKNTLPLVLISSILKSLVPLMVPWCVLLPNIPFLMSLDNVYVKNECTYCKSDSLLDNAPIYRALVRGGARGEVAFPSFWDLLNRISKILSISRPLLGKKKFRSPKFIMLTRPLHRCVLRSTWQNPIFGWFLIPKNLISSNQFVTR